MSVDAWDGKWVYQTAYLQMWTPLLACERIKSPGMNIEYTYLA